MLKFVFLILFFVSFSAESQSQRRSRGGGGGGSRSSGQSAVGSSGGSSLGRFMFDLQFYYGSGGSTANPPTVTGQPNLSNQFDSNTGFYSLQLSQVFASGWTLGALYAVRNDVRGSLTTKGQSQALGFGYLGESGGALRLFYHLGESYGDFADGRGGSAELGYYLKMTSQVSLGFFLTHQEIQYFKNPTIAGFKNWSASWSHPVITLAYSTR